MSLVLFRQILLVQRVEESRRRRRNGHQKRRRRRELQRAGRRFYNGNREQTKEDTETRTAHLATPATHSTAATTPPRREGLYQ